LDFNATDRSGRTSGAWPRAVTQGTFVDIVEHLVAELQRRGLYKRSYAPGTLRAKLFGGGTRLPQDHPAARFRWS
jgi:hypothetical protein